jgi:acetyltransferase-like isoleucine patch superfamily enzyme
VTISTEIRELNDNSFWGHDVIVEDDVQIGKYTILHPGTRICKGSRIGSHCEIGVPSDLADSKGLTISPHSLIRSHSVFYEGSRFGDHLTTGHRVTVRENTIAGSNFQIGTLSDIQGHCEIGDHVRFHSNVHIGQGAKIGNFVFIFPYVVLTNDPTPPSNNLSGVTVEDFAVIATMSTVLPGVKIGKDALVGAQSLVREDVPAGMICVGVPGKNVGSTSKIKLKSNGESAYPWRRHFHRGYPERVVNEWKEEFACPD